MRPLVLGTACARLTSTELETCKERRRIHYEEGNTNILGHSKDLWFLKANCLACYAQCLLAAVVRESGVPEVITDLTEAEADRFRNEGVMTADDVLDMHNFLTDFNGDFSRLFDQQ